MSNCITLSKGRKLPCKGGVGGIKALGIIPWSESQITYTAGEVTTFPASITDVYRYQVKNTGNTFNEEIAYDPETRSTVFNGTVSVVLNKLDLETRNELKMMAMGEVVIFVETHAGDIFVCGFESGADITGGTIAETGGAKTDFTGSKLTITYNSQEPYLRLSSAAKTAYAAQVVEGL